MTAPAHSESRLVVRGAGFGHGVGMSQYGALGLAKQGKDHGFILSHYYSGAQLGKLAGPGQVRVLLDSSPQIVFSGASGVAGGQSLDPALSYSTVRTLGGALTLRSPAGRDMGTFRSPLTIAGGPSGFVLRGRAANGVAGGRYRGNLQINAAAIGGLSAINAVDLEDYLLGVVPGEMPAGWPDEALRAQAVAARTYAVATSKEGDGFDQYADTRSQVYKGMAAEQPTTNAAVAATDGEIVIFDGKPIVTYYFSTSGGRTEDIENSFLGAKPAPYLVSVDDPFDGESPRHRWVVRMSLSQAERRLGGLVDGSLRQIKVLSRGKSPRVVRAQIVGSAGREPVSGPQLRRKLGLYAAWAQFTVITATGARGDGSKPSAPVNTGTSAGGAVPRLAARAASLSEVAGTITGRVAPVLSDGWVTVERLVGKRWVALFEARTAAGGRYSARLRMPGRYRVRYRGEAGPVVRVG
ncbi:MAG TPA: SpoIID/LytB domain-containing protein [Solirubrobacteraceae bacterium]